MRIQPIPGGDLESRIQRLEEVGDKHLGFGDVTTPESGTYIANWAGAQPVNELDNNG